MRKLLTFTAAALIASSAAHAATNADDDYGADMYKQDNRIESLFDTLDLNNDGEVTMNEYNALSNIGSLERSFETSFQAMDLDESGVITREEASDYQQGINQKWKYETKTSYKYENDAEGQKITEVKETYVVDVDAKETKHKDMKKTKRTKGADPAAYDVEVETQTYRYND